MERDALCNELRTLMIAISDMNSAWEDKDRAYDILCKAKDMPAKRLNEFDHANKELYIRGIIGDEPEAPTGLLKLAVPIYVKKKKEYKKALAEYKAQYSIVLSKYYEKFSVERERLGDLDNAEKEEAVQTANDNLSKLSELYDEKKLAVDENTILPDKLKHREAICFMIECIADYRADSIKEAVKLYYDELHWKKLEELAQEQLRLTALAEEHAKAAAESAESAAESASEAWSFANNAAERARYIADNINNGNYDSNSYDYDE